LKLVTVIGARPQFIKASVVSHEIKKCENLDEVIVHTGQHFDSNMSEVFFEDLGMNVPAYNLNIHGDSHAVMTGRMLIEIEKVLLEEKPAAVLVYGDTNSTLAGALAASKLKIPVAHVEAGLRSFNMAMPEEINRILTDRISRWLFTPTIVAEENLLREGIDPDQIISVGDVMYDVALHHGARIDENGRMMEKLGLLVGEYILATVHRAENTDNPDRLVAIVDALEAMAEQATVVWPLHPRTLSVLEKGGRLKELSVKVKLIKPVGYLDMVQLEKHATLIATDSGGVQKEAFFYEVPCVTFRDETEWEELVEMGWNRLASPSNTEAMHAAMQSAIGSVGKKMAPYGNGDAAQKIVDRLENDLMKTPSN
jgi:UDP-GlcNAc3NAcA epimerase